MHVLDNSNTNNNRDGEAQEAQNILANLLEPDRRRCHFLTIQCAEPVLYKEGKSDVANDTTLGLATQGEVDFYASVCSNPDHEGTPHATTSLPSKAEEPRPSAHSSLSSRRHYQAVFEEVSQPVCKMTSLHTIFHTLAGASCGKHI